jgi:bacilysin biosynthesis protein BacA
VRPGVPAAAPTVLATHPAPIPLVEYFAAAVPEFVWAKVTVREVSSTSVAARMVSTGEADMAITNAKAAEMFGLTFVSDYGPIQMDWILFAPRPAE